jgi:hypothetical protein
MEQIGISPGRRALLRMALSAAPAVMVAGSGITDPTLAAPSQSVHQASEWAKVPSARLPQP